MAQVFSRRFVLLLKSAGIALLVLLTVAVLIARAMTAEPHAIGEAPAQPVPFSHQHHVGDLGIDCRYCHASVETEATAGIPPLSTCMTCHSRLFTEQPALAPLVRSWQSGIPLQWQKVHQLPDFVRFDHSIHVAKGIGCVTCHGRVDRMPLTMRTQSLSMRWCLGCHRNPEDSLRPADQEFSMDWIAPANGPHAAATLGPELMKRYHIDTSGRLTECSTCHR